MEDKKENTKDRVCREKCPSCGSIEMLNTHYLERQKHDRVFVQCAKCGHLVAKYILRNYLDPDYHFQQILKLAKVTKGYSSGRKTARSWQDLPEKARIQFQRVVELLGENGEESPLEELFSRMEILEDDYLSPIE